MPTIFKSWLLFFNVKKTAKHNAYQNKENVQTDFNGRLSSFFRLFSLALTTFDLTFCKGHCFGTILSVKNHVLHCYGTLTFCKKSCFTIPKAQVTTTHTLEIDMKVSYCILP